MSQTDSSTFSEVMCSLIELRRQAIRARFKYLLDNWNVPPYERPTPEEVDELYGVAFSLGVRPKHRARHYDRRIWREIHNGYEETAPYLKPRYK